MDPELSVVIADDHAPMRAGIRGALTADGFTVSGEAATAKQAVDLVKRHRPDVCLLDIHMPGSGISAAAQIAATAPRTAVVMLTFSQADEDLFDSLRAGARGYLLKNMDPDRLGSALRGVLSGQAALPRELAARVLEEFRTAPRRKVLARGRRREELTSREAEIMELLEQGLSTTDVAERLFLSPGTVRVHVSSVLKKLQATDRAAALRMLKNG